MAKVMLIYRNPRELTDKFHRVTTLVDVVHECPKGGPVKKLWEETSIGESTLIKWNHPSDAFRHGSWVGIAINAVTPDYRQNPEVQYYRARTDVVDAPRLSLCGIPCVPQGSKVYFDRKNLKAALQRGFTCIEALDASLCIGTPPEEFYGCIAFVPKPKDHQPGFQACLYRRM